MKRLLSQNIFTICVIVAGAPLSQALCFHGKSLRRSSPWPFQRRLNGLCCAKIRVPLENKFGEERHNRFKIFGAGYHPPRPTKKTPNFSQ